MEKNKSTIFSAGPVKSRAMKIFNSESTGGHHVLPLGKNRATSEILWFITAGPQLRCAGRYPASSTPAAPGIYHSTSMADAKSFARSQH